MIARCHSLCLAHGITSKLLHSVYPLPLLSFNCLRFPGFARCWPLQHSTCTKTTTDTTATLPPFVHSVLNLVLYTVELYTPPSLIVPVYTHCLHEAYSVHTYIYLVTIPQVERTEYRWTCIPPIMHAHDIPLSKATRGIWLQNNMMTQTAHGQDDRICRTGWPYLYLSYVRGI